jgi:uncharacterized protein (UPF0335 family)
MKKGAKKELLNVDENIVASAIIKFKELKLKNDLCWYLSLVFRANLPQSFREYKLKFSLNDKPFLTRIEDLNRKKDDVKNDVQQDLFPSEGAKKTQLKNIDKEIEDVEAELKEMRDETPEFEFDATVEKLEYKDGDTIVNFIIDSGMVSQINDVKFLLDRHYKVDLIRE